MGLLLSVMVVCVGVLEFLACIHHVRASYMPWHLRRRRTNSLELFMDYFLRPIKDDVSEAPYDNTISQDSDSITPTNEESKSSVIETEKKLQLSEYVQENVGIECSAPSLHSESIAGSFSSRGRTPADQEQDDSSEEAPIFKDVTRKELAIQRRRSYRRRPVSSTSSDSSERASVRQEPSSKHRLHRPAKARSFEETTIDEYLERRKHFDQERIKTNEIETQRQTNDEPKDNERQLTETMGAGQTRQSSSTTTAKSEIPRPPSPERQKPAENSNSVIQSPPLPSPIQISPLPPPPPPPPPPPVEQRPPTPPPPPPLSSPSTDISGDHDEPKSEASESGAQSESKNQEPFWVRAREDTPPPLMMVMAPRDVDRHTPPLSPQSMNE